MLLALLSDTHDHTPNTLAALSLLAPHKPDAYLHAGDLVSPDMLQHFAGLPFHFVFGNNEYDHAAIRSRAKAFGLRCHNHLAELSFDGKRIALLHGHDHALTQKLLDSNEFDYLIHGHTHVRRDERAGTSKTRIVNPGALQRARTKSVALLDTGSDRVTFISLPAEDKVC